MTDAIVSLVVEKIADLLIQEAEFLSGVREEVKRLQDELIMMRGFLKDADSKKDQDRVRIWIDQVRDVAYEIEDVIDTFIITESTREVKELGESAGISTSRGRLFREVRKEIKEITNKIFTRAPHFHKIGKQIEEIRKRIKGISARAQTYQIQFVNEKEGSSSSNAVQQRYKRTTYPHKEEEHVINFEPVARDLKAQLMMEDEKLRVVSIVGMGGLGKTTLAKKVYNDIHVQQHFDCYAWAFISQQYYIRDMLVSLLIDVVSSEEKSQMVKLEDEEKSKTVKLEETRERISEEQRFKKILEKMGEDDLIKKLYKVLEENRYLVVLDDIWNNEAWNRLNQAFPNGKKGSKVLFTTRNKEVATYADPWGSPVVPPLLTDEQSWELLSRKAFLNDCVAEHGNAAELEKLGRQMVKKCGGLPFAVVVLGGLLATKKTMQEWEAVQRNINAQFMKLQQHHQYGGVYEILGLSYHDLPYSLKPCFLHLSQYPEDWEFHKRSMIRMWIAEGFIPHPLQSDGEEIIEDVAEQYLEELVSRSMVQVSERDYTGTGVGTFRMHDLMRDMCISKAKDENFAAFIEHRDTLERNNSSCFVKLTTTQSRRVAIQPCIYGDNDGKQIYAPQLDCEYPHLRSLVYFVERDKYCMTKDQIVHMLEKFRLLRILNLRGIKLKKSQMDKVVGNLIHLRSLGLRDTGLRNEKEWVHWRSLGSKDTGLTKIKAWVLGSPTSLPESIGNLKNLYTLDVRDNNLALLPNVFWKLENLRHLLLSELYYGAIRLDNLVNLETLKWVVVENLIDKGEVFYFPNLRSLGIYFNKREETELILKSPMFASNNRLHTLKMQMWSACHEYFPNLEFLSGCHHLTKLKLIGIIRGLHNLNFLPKTLVKLILSDSQLHQDPMSFLEKLPNLRFLSLDSYVYDGYQMLCSAKGFPRLEILILRRLTMLNKWKIEEDALPCLKTLYLDGLMIPEGLRFVTSLSELKLIGLGERLTRRVQVIDGVEGEDFHEIQHIPSISFNN